MIRWNPKQFFPPWRTMLVVSILALAGFLRFLHLGRQPLDLDEAATWWYATRESWRATLFADPLHPPLWWAVTRFFLAFLGDSESALRAPAALLGTLSVLLTWLLARRLLDPMHVPHAAGFRGGDARAPVWIAVCAATNVFLIEYSQQARMYSALLAVSLGMSLLYLSWLRSRRKIALVSYALLATLGLYTHHFTLLTMASHACDAVFGNGLRRRGKDLVVAWPFLMAQACAVLLFVPWLARTLGSGQGAATLGNYGWGERLIFALWRLMFGPSLAALDRPRLDAGALALLRNEAPLLLATSGVAAVCLLLGPRALRRDARCASFVISSISVPVLAVVLAYSKYPLVHEKYLIVVQPFLLTLAVLGMLAASKHLRLVLQVGLLGFNALGMLAYFAPQTPLLAQTVVRGHPYGKEEWRNARVWVEERAGRGDVVLLYPWYMHLPWDYYDRGRIAEVKLKENVASPEALLREGPELRLAPKVFLITSGTLAREREDLVQKLGQWTASGTGGGGGTGLTAERLFVSRWGVWAYEFAGPFRGKLPP